jgi:hypothetical protein
MGSNEHRGWLARRWDETARRFAGASKIQLVLDILNILAVVWQIVFPAWSAVLRIKDPTAAPPLGWYGIGALIVAVLYSNVHRFFLTGRFHSKQSATAAVSRSNAMAVAVEQLADQVRQLGEQMAHGVLDPVVLNRVEHGLLTALKSEVEARVGETDPNQIYASLMIEDTVDQEKLRCVNRSNLDRPIDRTYPKKEMVAWHAMQSQAMQQRNNFQSDDKPYRTIVAFPILERHNGRETCMGAITVVSQRPFHFEAHLKDLAVKVLPYVALHRLVLTYRRACTGTGR